MYKLIVYVPDGSQDALKTALFAAGAGCWPDSPYDCCAWQTLGTGQFRPLAGANPAVGTVGAICEIAEWRIEMLVPPACLHAVLAAYRAAHPYEAPAYDLIALIDADAL